MGTAVPQGNADGQPDGTRRLQGTVMILLCLSATLFYWTTKVNEIESHAVIANVEVKQKPLIRVEAESRSDGRCMQLCPKRREAFQEHFGANLLDIAQSLQAAYKARDRLVTKLKDDYGADNYQKMFLDSTSESKKYGFFRVANDKTKSLEDARRKMKIKILTVHRNLLQAHTNFEGCNCIDGDKPLDSTHQSMEIGSDVLAQFGTNVTSFVWTTGGHSASAAHGNMFNESYTAYMEAAAQDVFKAVGIDFVGNNYAMGGTGSGPELALCNQAIFGLDYDVLSWDFGMTDGKNYNRLSLYGYRAALSPSRPIIVGVELGGHGRRGQAFQEFADIGIPTFFTDHPAVNKMQEAIPDSADKTEDERNAMPPYVRDFKCGTQIEKGDPGCGKNKFTEYMCTSRRGKTGWHPGYKYHALQGNRMALFVSQILIEALEELKTETSNTANPDAYATNVDGVLEKYTKEEDEQYAAIFQQPLIDFGGYSSKHVDGLDMDVVAKTPGVCKTGRTPSYTRYSGILTETNKTGGFAPSGHEKYDVGLPMPFVLKMNLPPGRPMPLAYSDGREMCPAIVKPDYKDMFLTGFVHGWTKLSIPNKMEKEAFSYNPDTIKGYVFICPSACDWGKCKKDDVRMDKMDGLDKKVIELKVNDEPVTKVADMDGCLLLHGANGPKFAKNADGGFDIEVKVNQLHGYLRISSALVF